MREGKGDSSKWSDKERKMTGNSDKRVMREAKEDR